MTAAIKSERLSLRSYRPEDGRPFHEAAMESRRDLEPWMPWCHAAFAVEDAQNWASRQVEAFQNEIEFEFVILDREEQLVGGCGLNKIDRDNKRANLGYWIRSSATAQGYAAEAVRLLVAWAMANTDLQRIEVVVAVENERSLRVAEKAGAVREGVMRSRLLVHGRFHDAVMFSFVRPG